MNSPLFDALAACPASETLTPNLDYTLLNTRWDVEKYTERKRNYTRAHLAVAMIVSDYIRVVLLHGNDARRFMELIQIAEVNYLRSINGPQTQSKVNNALIEMSAFSF